MSDDATSARASTASRGDDVERDDWNRHWDDYAAAVAASPAQEYRRRLVLRLLASSSPPRRVLDIGSGTGDLAAELRRAFPQVEVVGLEISRSGVDLARRKVPDAVFLERDLTKAGDPPPEYRGWATHAICSEVLEHVDDPARLLRHAAAYLAPGCRLVVTVPGGPMTAFDRYIGHRRHFRPDELRILLETAGFSVERAAGVGFPFFNLYRLAVLARGRRLVHDVARPARETGSVPAAAMLLFRLLLRLDPALPRWGWQTVATATHGGGSAGRAPDR